MGRYFALTLALLGLLGFCRTDRAEPRILPLGDPVGDAIRLTAHDFLQKISDGDAAGAKALFAGPPDHEALLDAELRFFEHTNLLMKSGAAKSKGDFPGYPIPGGLLHGLIDDQLKRPVVCNGDFASVAAGSIPDAGLDLQRIDGKWKIIYLTNHFREPSAPTKFYTEMAVAVDRVQALVDAGKPDHDAELLDAFKAMAARMSEGWINEKPGPPAASAAPATTQPAPDLAHMAALIGKPVRDPDVQAIVPSLPGLPRLASFRDVFFINSYEAGLSFSFGLPKGELQAIHVYGAGDPEFTPCIGKLPHDLTFGESRASVERKLGRPTEIYGVGSSTFGVGYPQVGLLIEYGKPSGKDPLNPVCRITIFAPVTSSPAPATRPSGTSPRLTFRLVIPSNSPDSAAAEQLSDPSAPNGNAQIAVARQVLMDESLIADVNGPYQTHDQLHVWAVGLTMTPEGATKLESISTTHAGEQIAIVLDGKILMAPKINGKMSTHVSIDLGTKGNHDDARKLVDTLRDVLYSLPESTVEK